MSDAVRVYYCRTESLEPTAVSSAIDLLSVEERARCERLGYPEDRRDFAAAHALVRVCLAEHLKIDPKEIAIEVGDHGRPVLVGGLDAATAPAFSLSHTRGVVACAIAAYGVVGVDVEAIDATIDAAAIARRHFAAEEAAALEACAADERSSRFFEFWTLKEAILKACGVGLGLSLDAVCLRKNGHTFSLVRQPSTHHEWSHAVIDVGSSHKLAVAAAPGTNRRIIVSEHSHQPV
jgi:4'-phosphopantetheinyl transferase